MLSSPGHTCERGGLFRAQSVSISESGERTSQASLLSFTSPSNLGPFKSRLVSHCLTAKCAYWFYYQHSWICYCLKEHLLLHCSKEIFIEKVKCWFSWFALWMKWRVAGYRILKDSLVTPPRATYTLPASRFFNYYLNVTVKMPSGQESHTRLQCTTWIKMFWFSSWDVFL